jgi:hypothetical protein
MNLPKIFFLHSRQVEICHHKVHSQARGASCGIAMAIERSPQRG